MLFDGALVAIGTAPWHSSKDVPTKGHSISKAIEIIVNGLKVSLDMEAGGELSERLAALYDYMAERLLHANLHNSRPALGKVAGLLRRLRGNLGADRRQGGQRCLRRPHEQPCNSSESDGKPGSAQWSKPPAPTAGPDSPDLQQRQAGLRERLATGPAGPASR